MRPNSFSFTIDLLFARAHPPRNDGEAPRDEQHSLSVAAAGCALFVVVCGALIGGQFGPPTFGSRIPRLVNGCVKRYNV